MKIKKLLARSSPIILSAMAAAGMVGTVVLAIRTTPKAVELIKEDSRRNHDGDPYAYTKVEAVKSSWKCYMPMTAVGMSTIACIFGAAALGKKQQASLMSAYGLLNTSYKQYRNKLRELYGGDADREICKSIAAEKTSEVHIVTPGGFYSAATDFGESDEPEILRTFYDAFSGRYFESTISNVLQAEYHINRNLMLKQGVCVNEFYDFLGLEQIKELDSLGWSIRDECYWVDFDHRIEQLDDGMEIFVIDMCACPDMEWLNDF